MSKEAPLFVDLRMFPERPAKMNTPFPERLSEEDVVLSLVVLSLVVVAIPVEPELLAESSQTTSIRVGNTVPIYQMEQEMISL